MLLMILMEEKRLDHSIEKNRKKQFKNNLELKKQSIVKVTNYMFNGKDAIIHLFAG